MKNIDINTAAVIVCCIAVIAAIAGGCIAIKDVSDNAKDAPDELTEMDLTLLKEGKCTIHLNGGEHIYIYELNPKQLTQDNGVLTVCCKHNQSDIWHISVIRISQITYISK